MLVCVSQSLVTCLTAHVFQIMETGITGMLLPLSALGPRELLQCKADTSTLTAMSCCYLRIENAEGNVLIAVYLYACVSVIRISQKCLNRIA